MLPLRVALFRAGFGRMRNGTALLSDDHQPVRREGDGTPNTMHASISDRLPAPTTKPLRSWRVFDRR